MISDERIKQVFIEHNACGLADFVVAVKQLIAEAEAPLLKEIEALKHDLDRAYEIINAEVNNDCHPETIERCAKVCDEVAEEYIMNRISIGAEECAQAIRALKGGK